MKVLWIELSTGERDHSPVTIIGKTDSTWENQLNVLPIISKKGNEQ